jgi:hypothetical protein
LNILGEGFPLEINEQIKQRQKVYGSGYANGSIRSSEEIIYLNANTAWVKLISSVNIDNQTIIQNRSLSDLQGIGENKLAEKFVLFNGVTDNNLEEQRSGISSTNSILGNNNAYGIGGNDFGIQPMMGIKSANIKFENRGSLRRASVQIKAFNKIQFDIIDVLYIRLGFSMLLEWGNSMYFDNSGKLQKGSEINNSLATEFLSGKGKSKKISINTPAFTDEIQGAPNQRTDVFKEISKSLTYVDFLQLIEENRKNSNGNYDAMFAKVSNFHWTFNKDGSYDITLDLVSLGDVIESFKINVLNDGIITTPEEVKKDKEQDLTKLNTKQLINLFEQRNSIGKYFYQLTHGGFTREKVIKKEKEEISISNTLSFIDPFSKIQEEN